MNVYLLKAVFMPACFLFASALIFAQNRPSGIERQGVIIEGCVNDTNVNTLAEGKTKVEIMISRYPFGAGYMRRAAHKDYSRIVKNGEPFRFVLPALADRFYMSVSYVPKLGTEHWQSGSSNIYIIDEGDSIKCTLTNDAFRFEGRGADKLNCQTDIYKIRYRLDDSLMAVFESADYRRRFEILDRKNDSCLQLREEVVRKYRMKMGDELANVMLANCYGLRYWSSIRNERIFATNNSELYKAYLNSDGYKNIDRNTLRGLSPRVLADAPIYTDFLFEKIMMQTRADANGRLEINSSTAHIRRVFGEIKRSYTGIIRDKLLATFFIHWNTQPAISEYVSQSLQLIKDKKYKDIVSDISQRTSPGTPFYPFALEDTGGHIVNLKDMNDKVLIVDFWYTGCLACAKLKKAMSGIWQTFKDHPKVLFVSVSIDRNKEEWKKSVQSGMYTDPGAVNLYTNGQGKDHPLISDQRIFSYPRMFLLSKGKISSANLPYPDSADVTKGTTRDFIELVNHAISEL